jgi:hypothetical protein
MIVSCPSPDSNKFSKSLITPGQNSLVIIELKKGKKVGKRK